MDRAFSRRAAAALPLVAIFAPAAATVPTTAASPDPVFAQIELHRALRRAVNESSGFDEDLLHVTACSDEEAAIQALGDLTPATLAGAAAQLAYMAEIEEAFADPGSPLLRCALTVAARLQQMATAS